jgi:DNA-binding NtrC family response regulator
MNPKRILIIDDDDAVVFGYDHYLSQSGCTVASAAYLRDGMEKLENEEFDAVVFDVRLPDGSALDVIPTVRAKRPAIKIFVISGISDGATAQAALDGGADEFLVKPIAVSDLCVSIASALE